MDLSIYLGYMIYFVVNYFNNKLELYIYMSIFLCVDVYSVIIVWAQINLFYERILTNFDSVKKSSFYYWCTAKFRINVYKGRSGKKLIQ